MRVSADPILDSLADNLISSSNTKLPAESCIALCDAAKEVINYHISASTAELQHYAKHNDHIQYGIDQLLINGLSKLCASHLFLSSIHPDNRGHLIRFISNLALHLGNSIKDRAKTQLNIDILLPNYSEIQKHVEHRVNELFNMGELQFDEISSKLHAARQRHEVSVVFLNIPFVSDNYDDKIFNLFKDEQSLGIFKAPECPIDDYNTSCDNQLSSVKNVVTQNEFSCLFGIENWQKKPQDISLLFDRIISEIRHSSNFNRVIVIPVLSKKNRNLAAAMNSFISSRVPFFYYSVDSTERKYTPVDWESKFGPYSDKIKYHTCKIVARIFEDVVEDISDELSDRQKMALSFLDDDTSSDIIKTVASYSNSLGLDAQRNRIKKMVLDFVLKKSTPNYSIKRNPDPLEFYHLHLEPNFLRLDHPVSSLNEVAPNLSRTLRERKLYPQKRSI